MVIISKATAAIGVVAVAALVISSITLVLVLQQTEGSEQSWCSYNEGIKTIPPDINLTIPEHAIPFAMTQPGEVLIQFSFWRYVYVLTGLYIWINLDGDTVMYIFCGSAGFSSVSQETTLTSLSPGAHVVTVIIEGSHGSNSLNNSILCVTYTPM